MAPANVLVNSAAIDASNAGTGQVTQSETSSLAYTNGSGQHIVIVAFNDSAGLRHRDRRQPLHRLGPLDRRRRHLHRPQPPARQRPPATPATRSWPGTPRPAGSTSPRSCSTAPGCRSSAPTTTAPASRPRSTAAPNISGGSTDKEWIAVDNNPGPGQGTVYLVYRDFGSGNGIYLTKSTNQGATWTNGDTDLIASGNAGNVQGANVAVGPDHSVYAFYYDATATPATIKVRRSTNGGTSFGAPTVVTTLASAGVNGDLGLSPGFRTSGFPQGAVNPSQRPGLRRLQQLPGSRRQGERLPPGLHQPRRRPSARRSRSTTTPAPTTSSCPR